MFTDFQTPPGSFRYGGGSSLPGRVDNAVSNRFSYPHPFFDLASTWMPTTLRALLVWCRYYFFTHPLINTISYRMAEYPVTDIVIDHERPATAEKWSDFLQEQLRIRSFQIESGLDYNVYGNAFVSIWYPLRKYLRCSHCRRVEEAMRIRDRWTYVGHSFRLTCSGCDHTGPAEPFDIYVRSPDEIRLHRWNPEDIDIQVSELNGEHTYYYSPPLTLRNDILSGKKEIVATTPQLFLQSVKESKAIILSPDNIFHFKRPTLSGKDRGWGLPLILPVLKSAFYLQVMQKAQEQILVEHIVPMRVLYPQPSTGSSDPYAVTNLSAWREAVGAEIARWRIDRNYIPILPLPIGQQIVGGDGKALLLNAEMQAVAETIVTGMGVPKELIYGGASWSGSNVSLRMLENIFLGYILMHKRMLRWVIERVSTFLGWPMVTARMKPFKMADDLQQRAFELQLAQLGKLSDTTLLARGDYSQAKENELIVTETKARLQAMRAQQIAMAEIQGEQQLVMARYQVKAQQLQQQAAAAPPAQGEAGDQGGAMGQMASPLTMQQGPGMDLRMAAQQQAMALATQPPELQQQTLAALAQQMGPEYAAAVQQALAQMGPPQGAPAAPQVDARPLPQQRAPRRDNASV
jgi:hypothetical protein